MLLRLFFTVIPFLWVQPALAGEGSPPVSVSSEGHRAETYQDYPPTHYDYKDLVGQKAEDVDRSVFGNTIFVRILKPNQMVTMEYREDRVNLNVDENGVILSVACS